MIISASRRTDIPAFYSDWFMKRIREGYFYRVNPFNSKQVTGISLKVEHLDAIVFWTKNPEPLMAHLDELDQRGYRYYFQFTLNPYGKEFEPHLPALETRIATFQKLAEAIGAERIVWRYDPVILSSITPIAWHLEQAGLIASRLQNATERMMFSFYDFYGKGNGRLAAALKGSGILLEDITATEKSGDLRELAKGFAEIADAYNQRIFSCCEEVDLSPFGIEHGSCIDGKLLEEISGFKPAAVKDKNQRLSCGCLESADMGMYNTCRFRCRYCYANFNEKMIDGNNGKHDPESPSLLCHYQEKIHIRTSLRKGHHCETVFRSGTSA